MKRIPLFLAVLSLSLAFQAQAAVILIDFNTSGAGIPSAPDANGNFWNATNTGVTVNLNDTTNTSTGITMTGTVGNTPPGGNSGGTTTPDVSALGSLAILAAVQDNITFTAAQGATSNLTLSGLSVGTSYTFELFSSRTTNTVQVVRLTVTGANSGFASVQASGAGIGSGTTTNANDSDLAVVNSILADGSNQIVLAFSLDQGPNGYINALRITTSPVPEPSTMGMLMGGGFLLMGVLRFRRSLLG